MWSRAVLLDFSSLVIGIINWLVNGLISVSWSGWINTAMENRAWWLVARSTTTRWGVARYLPADQNCNKSPMLTTMEPSMGETRVHCCCSFELSVSTSRPPKLSWKDNKRQMRQWAFQHWYSVTNERPRVRKIYFQLKSLLSKRVGRLHFNITTQCWKITQTQWTFFKNCHVFDIIINFTNHVQKCSFTPPKSQFYDGIFYQVVMIFATQNNLGAYDTYRELLL